jgi:hypothetical protein
MYIILRVLRISKDPIAGGLLNTPKATAAIMPTAVITNPTLIKLGPLHNTPSLASSEARIN